MLLSFSSINSWSFDNGFKVDLRNGSSGDFPASNMMGIIGNNGSGASNILKSLVSVVSFVLNSHNYPDNEELHFEKFRYSKENAIFSVNFIVGDVQYEYCLSVSTKVVYESLIARGKDEDSEEGRRITRSGLEIRKNTFYEGSENVVLRENESILSTLKRHRIKEIDDAYSFFENITTNLTFRGIDNKKPYATQNEIDSEYCKKTYKDFGDFHKLELFKFDTHNSNFSSQDCLSTSGEECYCATASHGYGYKEYYIAPLGKESKGVQKLYSLFYHIFKVLRSGGVAIIDDLDQDMHPLHLKRLLEYFYYSYYNKTGRAQIIFTTKNPLLFDLLDRNQITIVNHNYGRSYCYRLDSLKDIDMTPGEKLSQLYLDGKLGGVPRDPYRNR